VLFIFVLVLGLAGATWLTLRVEKLEREVAALRAAVQGQEPRSAAGVTRTGAGPAAARPGAVDPGAPLAGLFERVVGGRLLIWVGGIALAAAGIFLIRHSIGRLAPETRMIGSALLGLLLIGAGEGARRGRFVSDDPRIAQALVGAGLAVLYATAYGSHLLFGLIGSGTASVLMVAITGAALVLALRHGAPTAALGLVGGFATPLLVGNPDAGAIPVLAYLALLNAAIFAVARRRGWAWLPATGVAASFAWTGWFLMNRAEDALPAGLFAALLGVAASLPRSGQGRWWVLPPIMVALVEVSILVGRDDIAPVAWLVFGVLAVAALLLAHLRAEHRFAPPLALLLALLLLAIEVGLAGHALEAPVAVAVTLLFAAGSLPGVAKGRILPTLTASAALAGPFLILRVVAPDLLGPPAWGMLGASLAASALALLPLGRRAGETRRGRHGVAGTAALLLAVAARDLVPHDLLSGAWLLLATGLLLAGIRTADKALRVAGLALLTATVCKVFLVDAAELEGVLRILSFMGLGVALIGIGMLYGRVLRVQATPTADQASA
jgi:uncharacterized membrane protein